MSTAAATAPRDNAATRQSRKKMKILAALAAITLFTWSRQLLGGSGDEKPSVEVSKPGSAAAKGASAAAAKAPKSAKSILNFEQAMERMKQWPEALHRRVIEGPIEDLTPQTWMNDADPTLSDEAGDLESGLDAALSAQAQEDAWTQEHADGSGLGITLRSTVIFGAKRYAVLNGVRYAEGEPVVITNGPGAGRYLLVSVRSREVVLSSGDRTWTLVIRDQSVPAKDPDQAQ